MDEQVNGQTNAPASDVPEWEHNRHDFVLLTSHWLSRFGFVLIITAASTWLFFLPTELRGDVENPYNSGNDSRAAADSGAPNSWRYGSQGRAPPAGRVSRDYDGGQSSDRQPAQLPRRQLFIWTRRSSAARCAI